jgi:hypothetical protein
MADTLRDGQKEILRPAGHKRTNAAAVAVVKSFNRLVARDLATRKYNFGIILTDEGRRVADQVIKSKNRPVVAPEVAIYA